MIRALAPLLLLAAPFASARPVLGQCSSSDSFEENDTCEVPAPLASNASDLRVSKTDQDWYTLSVPALHTLEVAVRYSSAVANLDAALYTHCVSAGFPNGLLAFSDTPGDDELLTWSNQFQSPDQVLLRIRVPADSAGDCNAYDLEFITYPNVPGDVGTNYCIAVHGSQGIPTIHGQGSASVSANDLRLLAYPVFPNFQGIFYYGPEETQLPFCAGYRCVGPGNIGTFRLPVIVSDGSGVATHNIDLTNPPYPAGQITPATTWNFQYWFRDPTHEPCSFHLTDALSLTFLP